jgi:dipeptidyl aminopeptidase/acylaminoacyl peptidase
VGVRLVYLYEMTAREPLFTRRPGGRTSLVVGLVLIVLLAVLIALVLGGCNGDAEPPDGTATPSSGTGSPTIPGSPTGTITAGGRLAFIANDGNLTLIKPDGSGAEAITEGGGVQRYAWSPNGGLIALERQDGDGTKVEVIRPGGDAVFEVPGGATPVWSPQSDRLLVAREGGLDLLDAGGQAVRTIPSAVLPDWSSDGSAIAFVRTSSGGKGVPMIITLASGEEQALDASIAPDELIYPVLWHPGGAVIAFRNVLYEPATGAKTDLPGPVAYFSPDGRLVLVIGGPDPTVSGRPAWLLDLTQGAKEIIGLEVRPAPDETPPWLFIKRWTDWTRDGRFLFYLDPDEFRPRVRIYDTVAIRQDSYRDIRGEYPDFSPDGTHATFQHDGKVWVFPLDASALPAIAEGSLPAWQPAGP